MKDFSLHHRSNVTPKNFTPKQGELVSAKFSDGSWYRAKIRRSSPMKKEAEVSFIDYGNQETLSYSEIRPLDPRFSSLPGQAQEARLRLVVYIGCLEKKTSRPKLSVSSNSQIRPANMAKRPLLVSGSSAIVEG